MEEINALDLLKEEMETDEVHLKVNAIHRLKTVIMSLDKEEVRSDLFTYINSLIDMECDEVLFAISEELGKSDIYSLCDQSQLLEVLEKLAQ